MSYTHKTFRVLSTSCRFVFPIIYSIDNVNAQINFALSIVLIQLWAEVNLSNETRRKKKLAVRFIDRKQTHCDKNLNHRVNQNSTYLKADQGVINSELFHSLSSQWVRAVHDAIPIKPPQSRVDVLFRFPRWLWNYTSCFISLRLTEPESATSRTEGLSVREAACSFRGTVTRYVILLTIHMCN